MSDSESVTQQGQKRASLIKTNFSANLLPPIVDLPPPSPVALAQRELVTYNKEVQTMAWVPDEESEGEDEESLRRRVEEELRKELERLRVEEKAVEELDKTATKELPGNTVGMRRISR